jgi:hypothetical protein
MKLLLLLHFFLASPALAYTYYKNCRCQPNDQTYLGKEYQNIASDINAVKACREPGKVADNGVDNLKLCFRYDSPPFIGLSRAINNCNGMH